MNLWKLPVIFLFTLFTFSAFGACPIGDFDGNCKVDITDLQILASQWLNPDCSSNPDDCADLNELNGINNIDLAIFAQNWLTQGSPLIISEFLAVNSLGLRDQDNESSDWIEVFNQSDTAVNLEGWRLTDSSSDLNKWKFPAIILNPDESLIVFASKKDRVDPANELHTNFSLSGNGEYLALVKPDGSISHEFAPYPQQFADISYGVNNASSIVNTIQHTLVAENAPAKAYIPQNYSLGLTWTGLPANEPFDDSAWLSGTTGIGYNYPGYIGLDVGDMRYNNQSVYARIPFNVDDPSIFSSLILSLKFEDGFVAYINGTVVASFNVADPYDSPWDDGSTANRLDGTAVTAEEFNITPDISALKAGTNILAFHGLNYLVGSSDLLIMPELIAEEFETIDTGNETEGYFTIPTPGSMNNGAVVNLGPAIWDVTEDPIQPLDGEDIAVTARVVETFAPVTSVTLKYRVGYGSETTLQMYDDGLHFDGIADDNIYGATIPAGASDPGDMVRWYVSALDSDSKQGRNPLFPHPTNSPEYFGTVIKDPAITSDLPIMQWFTLNESASRTRAGTRASIYYDGRFYDNMFVRQRGGYTSGDSQKFDFNKGFKFRFSDDHPRVDEFNFNENGSDSSYIRQPLAFETHGKAGAPSCISFHLLAYVNGSYDRVGIYIEQVDEEFMVRNDMDPSGALYKFVQRTNMYPVFHDTTTGVEKKTREYEDFSDLQALIDGLNASTENLRRRYAFDNFNLPEMMNYLAARALLQDTDDIRKNFYFHRDTNNTGEWSVFPWDKDWTFGIIGDGGTYAAHPFLGDDAHDKNGQWNVFFDVIYNLPETRQMYLRRLRSVMDQQLQPPSTPSGSRLFEQRVEEMHLLIQPYLSVGSAVNSLKNYFSGTPERRRTVLYETHNINSTSSPAGGVVGIPNSQPANPNITFGAFDYNPSSNNQDQEYIELVNNESYAVDLSGWKLTGGVDRKIDTGTVILASGSLYLTPDSAAFRARTVSPKGNEGRFVQGNYKGHLSSWGETVQLLDPQDTLVDELTYTGSPSDQQRYIRVTEIMYHPPVGGAYNEEEYEFIELRNTAASSISLDGLKFSAGIAYDFSVSSPGMSLTAGQTVVIVRNQAAFAERYDTSAMNIASGTFTGYLSNTGERVKLDDQTNSTILEFDFNDGWYELTDGYGFSLVIVDASNPILDSWDEKSSWRPSYSSDGSPSADDPAALAAPGAVVINELLTHTDLPDGDWIELYNTTGSAVNIGGWYLSDSANDFTKYRIDPADPRAMIPAGGYVVFTGTADFKNPSLPSSKQFGLSDEHGEQIYLTSGAAGQLGGGYQIDQNFEASRKEKTFSRHINSLLSGSNVDFVATEPSRGTANNAPIIGPVVITEMMYNSPDLDSQAEFIELKNISTQPVDLYDTLYPDHGWKFTDGIDYTFTDVVTLASSEVILLTRDNPADFRTRYGISSGIRIFGPYMGQLDNSGEKLELSMPGDTEPDGVTFSYIRADYVNFKDSPPWPESADGFSNSLNRTLDTAYGNDVANWTDSTPTPGT